MWPFKKKKIGSVNRKRYYQGASIGRLTNNWTTTLAPTSEELKTSLRILRARSRDLTRNNVYARRFINMVQVNVVGHVGFRLQSKVVNSNGTSDSMANQKIENAFQKWSKRGVCEVSGKLSWLDCQRLIVTSVVRDGEAIVRRHTGPRVNDFAFAIELIDPDRLDENYNLDLENGNEIRMGIEFNSFGRPIAYHLFKKHPGNSFAPRKRERVPAQDVNHLFIPERVGQERGVPHLASAMARIKMLDGYEEAELVASRTAASKMGFFVSPDGDGFEPDDEEENTGALISEAEPGTFEQLPEGMDFKAWNPEHPNSAFKDFEKAILRGIASGWNVSYVGLANDLEGVSYSSIRQGELADRDNWRMFHVWMIEHCISFVWDNWIDNALGYGLELPQEKFDKFNRPSWQSRGWAWVDPQKEIAANKEAVRAGFKSVSEVISEQGKDPEEVFARIAKDKDLAEKYGITLDVLTEMVNDG